MTATAKCPRLLFNQKLIRNSCENGLSTFSRSILKMMFKILTDETRYNKMFYHFRRMYKVLTTTDEKGPNWERLNDAKLVEKEDNA